MDTSTLVTPYSLPALPYDYAELEPWYSAEALRLHHDTHHAGYVKKANELSNELTAGDLPPAALSAAERSLAFNVAGHVLHSAFWPQLSPVPEPEPSGPLADAIARRWGSVASVKERLDATVTTLEGSGWAMLLWETTGERLAIQQIHDHHGYLTPGGVPLLVIDGWEHAFYLDHQADKAAWLESFWHLLDWDEISQRFDRALTVSPS